MWVSNPVIGKTLCHELLAVEKTKIKKKRPRMAHFEKDKEGINVTRKKSSNVFTSCPKMISLEKLKILKPLQKYPIMWAN